MIAPWRPRRDRLVAHLALHWTAARERWMTSPSVRWATALCILAVLVVAVAEISGAQAHVPDGPVLDGIVQSYRTASRAWLPRLVPAAQRTFTLLAGLEFAISGLLWGLRRDHLDDIAAKFLIKFTLAAFLLTLITSFDAWVPRIIDGFVVAGERATGASGLSPSGILDIGWQLSAIMLDAISLKNAVLNPISSGFIVLLAFGMWLSFVCIASQMLRVLVESYLVLTGGIIFLGFSGFRVTAGYAEAYLNYAVFVGIKIFILYLIVGTGMDITTTWAALLKADNWNIGAGDSTLFGQVFGGCVLFATLAVTLPGSFASRITAQPTLGIANALRSL